MLNLKRPTHTVKTFCEAYNLNISTFFAMRTQRIAPKLTWGEDELIISNEDEDQWLKDISDPEVIKKMIPSKSKLKSIGAAIAMMFMLASPAQATLTDETKCVSDYVFNFSCELQTTFTYPKIDHIIKKYDLTASDGDLMWGSIAYCVEGHIKSNFCILAIEEFERRHDIDAIDVLTILTEEMED